MVSPVDSAFDPMTFSLINAGSNVLGKAMSPAPAQSRADSSSGGTLDSSGWVISFGGNAVGASKIPWYGWAAIGVGLVVWLKRK